MDVTTNADAQAPVITLSDAALKEVKRLPMKKPVGKYNVFNKTTRSAGTSH